MCYYNSLRAEERTVFRSTPGPQVVFCAAAGRVEKKCDVEWRLAATFKILWALVFPSRVCHGFSLVAVWSGRSKSIKAPFSRKRMGEYGV